MKLADIHQAFISGIYDSAQGVLPEQFIKAGEALSPEQCLSVYRGSVYGNLTSALADIYPAFVQCVGEEFFEALALRYIKTHPSRSASLDKYGQNFSEFVSTFEPLQSLPYAEDLVHLEWLWHRAFHAKDDCALDPLSLQNVPEERYDDLVFSLPDSSSLMASQYPIRDIWQQCLSDRDKKQNDSNELLEWNSGAQYLLIWRADNYEMRVDTLSDIEFQLLSAVNKKLRLGTILTELQSKHSIEEINQTFAGTVKQGWFTSFDLAG